MAAVSEYVASFVIYAGELGRSVKGERIAHFQLASRVARACGEAAPSGDFVSGAVSSLGGQAFAAVGPLNGQVSESEASRLIREGFAEYPDLEVRFAEHDAP